MKRKLPWHNPIRDLRNCLGLTQARFANRYKLTARQLQVMELGPRAVPQELARRWSLDYGVDADWMRRRVGFARMIGGKRVTASLIEAWKDIHQQVSPEERERAVEQALSQVNAILRTSPAEKLPGILAALGNAFDAIVADYRLKSAISNFLDDKAVTGKPTQIRIRDINPCYRRLPIWRKASAKYSPDEFAVVTARLVPLWLTLGPEIRSGYRVEVTAEVRKQKHTFAFKRITRVATSAAKQPLKILLNELAG
jgi:hypothetical protein